MATREAPDHRYHSGGSSAMHIGVFLGLGIAFLAQPRVDNHSSLELTAARR